MAITQLILCVVTQKAINVKSNIKDKQALLSAKLSKKTLTYELLKNSKNKQRKPKSQFHNAINRKSFYAFQKKKGHEEGGAMSSVPQKIHKKYFTLLFRGNTLSEGHFLLTLFHSCEFSHELRF